MLAAEDNPKNSAHSLDAHVCPAVLHREVELKWGICSANIIAVGKAGGHPVNCQCTITVCGAAHNGGLRLSKRIILVQHCLDRQPIACT